MKFLLFILIPVLLPACINSSEYSATIENSKIAGTTASGRVKFIFASAEQGAEALMAEDRFTQNLQPREIGTRTQYPAKTSLNDLLLVYSTGTEEWNDEQRKRISDNIDALSQKLAKIEHALPETIYMTLINSTVDGGLSHTRGTTIMFSVSDLESSEETVTHIFLHELHHILSRHNSSAHNEYYALIGYKPCKIEIPEALNVQRLTNPDAPTNSHYVPVSGEPYDGVVPFLFADRDYVAGSNTPYTQYFNFGLLSMTKNNGSCQITNDLKSILKPNEVTDFTDAIGENTRYIIHPEETLADNFVFWATDKEDLPNPEIPEEVGAFWSAFRK